MGRVSLRNLRTKVKKLTVSEFCDFLATHEVSEKNLVIVYEENPQEELFEAFASNPNFPAKLIESYVSSSRYAKIKILAKSDTISATTISSIIESFRDVQIISSLLTSTNPNLNVEHMKQLFDSLTQRKRLVSLSSQVNILYKKYPELLPLSLRQMFYTDLRTSLFHDENKKVLQSLYEEHIYLIQLANFFEIFNSGVKVTVGECQTILKHNIPYKYKEMVAQKIVELEPKFKDFPIDWLAEIS